LTARGGETAKTHQDGVEDRHAGMNAPEHNDQDHYLTVQQACNLAAISRSTFYRLLSEPKSGLPQIVVRIPIVNRIRVPRQRFCEWLEGALAPRVRERGPSS
jgi:excisionase family DNA binding protein